MKLVKANILSHREGLTDDLAPTTGRSSGRWFALIVLCLGALMIVLDTTIVNVALPSIRQDLGFSETSLAWVVNAYLLTFGGFLLLGGRGLGETEIDRKSTRLNSSHTVISYAVFCLKKKKQRSRHAK